MQEYTLGFMFDEARERVVLIKKENPSWQRGKLNGVGGKVELGETPYSAMVREFEEETGVLCEDWKFLMTLVGNSFQIYVYYTFDDKMLNCQTKEIEEVKIFNIYDDWKEICGSSISNIPWLLMLCLDFDVHKDRLLIDAEYVDA